MVACEELRENGKSLAAMAIKHLSGEFLRDAAAEGCLLRGFHKEVFLEGACEDVVSYRVVQMPSVFNKPKIEEFNETLINIKMINVIIKRIKIGNTNRDYVSRQSL